VEHERELLAQAHRLIASELALSQRAKAKIQADKQASLIARQRLLREQEAQQITEQRQRLESQGLALAQQTMGEQQAALDAQESRIVSEQLEQRAPEGHQGQQPQFIELQDTDSNLIKNSVSLAAHELGAHAQLDADRVIDATDSTDVNASALEESVNNNADLSNVDLNKALTAPINENPTALVRYDNRDEFELYLQRNANNSRLTSTRIAFVVTALIAGAIFWWWTKQPAPQVQPVASQKKAVPYPKESTTTNVDPRVSTATNPATKDATIFEPKLDKNFEKLSPKK
jgi:hypothetical protein